MVLDDKPLYVALDAGVPMDEAPEGVMLVRKVPATYLDESVYNVMQKMIDPEGDSLNDSYNTLERQVANIVKGWFEEMERNPTEYKVTVAAFPEEGDQIPLDLDSNLRDYESVVKFKQETETDSETGEVVNERYKLVDLFARRAIKSGIDSLL